MRVTYNLIAGQSVERLAALSDGIFAVAMTILVLDLHAPAAEAVQSEMDLWQALLALVPRFMIYLMSFMTLGIFWVGQQTQLNQLARSNRNLTWLHLAFLFSVTLTPFSTALEAEFMPYRAALIVYWANILLLGVLLLASWRHAIRADVVREDAPAEIVRGIEQRIVYAQLLYGLGALLCIASPYWSLGFIVLVQLNYVLAPRIGILQRL